MSSPGEWYNSLPPITKGYGTLCLLTTVICKLGVVQPVHIALFYERVFPRLEVWRLITNFFFLGPFSFNFGIRLLMIARYGVNLEKGPFDRRTADFLWMLIFGALSLLAFSLIPPLWTPFLGISLVFMLLYVWSREFPDLQVNLYGLVALKAFYLPWAMLALDVIFAGHLYYFLTVLRPLSTGQNLLKTPLWLHRLVARWGLGAQVYPGTRRASVAEGAASAGRAFSGRSYRLNR
ncbi:unnamed protein product [Spirodela intermedia]|uniref:Derlin n=1 Tax=Spirodela intermedia TaxID=51605 RepID=A0A7I8JSY7_SPIIN|nr:unnamed protein product [Spirodela intermedia]CAA6672861.1 unnamed protein product [Spirodela intermedia]